MEAFELKAKMKDLKAGAEQSAVDELKEEIEKVKAKLE